MTKKCVFASNCAQQNLSQLTTNSGSYMDSLPAVVKMSLLGSTFAAIALFALPTPVAAQQTIVIDVNVVGLNTNQAIAQTQLAQACDSLDGNANDQATALQATCDLIDSLNPDDPDNPERNADARRLKQITDAVAPEEIFALNDSLVALSDFQTTNVHARLNTLRNSVLNDFDDTLDDILEDIDEDLKNPTDDLQEKETARLSDSLSGITATGGGASSDLFTRLGGFINGHGSDGDFSGSGLQQGSDISSASMTFGADYRFNNNLIAGAGLGFLQDSQTFTRVDGGTDSQGFNVTAYGTWYARDKGYVDFVLDVGQVDHELERSVSIDPEATLLATSSPSSVATSLTISGGRNFKVYGWDLGGYGRLSLTRAKISSYRESLKTQQAGFAALFAVDNQAVTSTTVTVGVELSKAISSSRAVILPLLRLEYVNESEQSKDDVEATLITTGTSAKYKGDDRVADYINLGVGASAVLSGGRHVYAYYETHLQHDLISQDWLKVGARLEF